MANKIDVTDPRGKSISCSEECWNIHIVGARPWMYEWEDRVKQSLISPDLIFQDVDFPDRHCYYYLEPKKKKYMKVVVQFESDKMGKVITAFPSDSIKNGEKLLWSK